MDETKDRPEKPKFPSNSIHIEADPFQEICLICNSSLARKWFIFKTGGCINPDCENYGNSKIK